MGRKVIRSDNMIDIKYKECCKECPHLSVNSEQTEDEWGKPLTEIGCDHMEVCYMYIRANEPVMDKETVKMLAKITKDALKNETPAQRGNIGKISMT
jgi:hypothetical protein